MGAMSSSSSKDKQGSDSGPDSCQQYSLLHKPTLADTTLVRTYLMRALHQPAELADLILDYADYAPHVEASRKERYFASATPVQSIITTKLSREQRIALRRRTGGDKVAATTTYAGPRNSIAALCLVTDPIPGGRWPGEEVKVKKVRFLMWSKDQGWGGNPSCKASYRGSYSWTEAVIIRPLPITNPSPSAPVKTEDIPYTTIAGKDLSGAPMTTDRHNNYGPDSLTLKIDSLAPPYPDPANLEAHFFEPRGYQLVPRVRRSKGRKGNRGQGKDDDEEIYRSWTVQHNLVAVNQLREHVVEWWNDDDNSSNENEDNDKDDETGKGSGKGFVRTLRPGDRVGILARALFPGWSNKIENIKVEIDTYVRY